MAKQVKLAVERRDAIGRAAVRKLKARGVVPAVVYGGKEKPEPLQVLRRDVSVMLSHASGENILVELEIAGEKTTRSAMVQEVQHSPVGGDVLHIDFHAVSMDEEIDADVPLEPTGTANGVKNFNLNIGDSIHVRDIKLPNEVAAKVQPELTVFSVLAPIVEEEPVAPEAETAAGPEVIKEKKEEGEGTAPGASAPAAPAKEKEQKK